MSQQKVWDNIAQEWYMFKTSPANHVSEFLKNKKGKILDLGSGAGRHLQKIKQGKMYLVDFSKKMIRLAKQRAQEKGLYSDTEFVVSDIKKLPFPDNFFDSAICIAIFHCLNPESQDKAVKELFRVLKPNAQAEIAVWNKQTKRFKNSPKERYVAWRDKGARYYYLFEPQEIYNLFKKHGFKIIRKEKPRRNIVFIVKKP